MIPYAEFIEFIAAGVTSEQIVNFKPSATSQRRLEELLSLIRSNTISAEERRELDHFNEMEHIMRMAKIRAWKYVEGK
ncbi:hypothetical protein [Spirosoma areae]